MSKTMSKAMSLIAQHEGVRTMMYSDTKGIKTIGVGHNLESKPIPMEAVGIIFEADYAEAVEQLQREFIWFDTLGEARQAVVIDMVFNLGLNGFKGFKHTIEHIASGRYSHAAAEMMDSLWASQVGGRADELADMMRSGEWL